MGCEERKTKDEKLSREDGSKDGGELKLTQPCNLIVDSKTKVVIFIGENSKDFNKVLGLPIFRIIHFRITVPRKLDKFVIGKIIN